MKTNKFIAEDKKEIVYYSWEVKEPKAVFQIVHGSIEYALRYDEFAKELNKAGFSVYAMDVRGHGATETENRGHIADVDGADLVLKDVHQLNKIIKEKNGDIKLALLGHSMGSFIVRAYVTKYHDVDILIAIGTNHKPKAMVNLLRYVAKTKAVKRGGAKPGKFLNNLSYKAFDKKFKGQGDLAWLSLSKENRKNYRKSPLTKFIMSNQSFYEFSTWMKMFTNKNEVQNMSPDLRILLLNGTDDPVGSMGKEVIKANKMYTKLGYYCAHIEYRDLRHEILNEETRELVYEDIIGFVSSHGSNIKKRNPLFRKTRMTKLK